MRLAVIASLLSACYPVEGNECSEGPFWDGPALENPHVASTGDRLLVTWREYIVTDDGVIDDVYRGTLVDDAGVVAGRFDFEPGLEPAALLSGPDRALVTGELDGGGSFYELRLASGTRVGPVELPGFTGTCAFDGDGFLITRPGGLVRIAPDGSAGPPIAIAGIDKCAATDAVTWVMTGGSDEPIEGRRIARGGGLLDATPRRILDDSFFYVTAARPTETAVVAQDRDRARTWIRLANDGTVTAMVPLVLESELWRPIALIAERDGYLLVNEDSGSATIYGVRVAPDGAVLGASFVLLEHALGNTLALARTTGATTLVYDQLSRGGEAPQIAAIRIADGVPPGEPATIETVAGEAYTVDCGCQVGRGGGWLLALAILGLCRSRSRGRRSRRPTS